MKVFGVVYIYTHMHATACSLPLDSVILFFFFSSRVLHNLFFYMAVSGKMLVGNNNNSAWNYGGETNRFAAPIELSVGP